MMFRKIINLIHVDNFVKHRDMTKYKSLNDNNEKTVNLTLCWIITFMISLGLFVIGLMIYWISQVIGMVVSGMAGLNEICDVEDDDAEEFFVMCPLIGFPVLVITLLFIATSIGVIWLTIYITKKTIKYSFKRVLNVNIVCCGDDPISHLEDVDGDDIEMKKIFRRQQRRNKRQKYQGH